MTSRRLGLGCAIPVLLLAAACGADQAPELVALPTATASPEATATAEPTAPPATPTPVATPTPEPEPERLCRADPRAYEREVGELEADVDAALAGYPGTFGFALYDLDCDAWATVNPDHRQYTASTGKLPFVIAALRAVEAGTLDFAAIEQDLELVLRLSLDDPANRIVARVDEAEVREVLRLAGMSDQTDFGDSWSNFFSTAVDLTRLWVSLMRGELLNEEHTELVLQLTSEAEVDPAFETFYSDFDAPGLIFGQKVGHAVIFAPPYYMVGSGYLVPDSGVSRGFATTLVVTADSLDPRRKDVFPLVLDFAQAAVAEVEPQRQ